MPTSINTQNCAKELLGTGLLDCVIRKGKINSVLKVKPDWSFNPATETFNLAYVILQVQKGVFVPFLNTLDTTSDTPESYTKEYGDHSIAVVGHGKPQRSLEFDNGPYWHAAAASYAGFRNGGVIEIDINGRVWLQRNVAGTKLTAWATNMFDVPTYTDPINDETGKTYIKYQIRNEVAWTEQMTSISKAVIGADLNEELKGFNNVVITGTAVASGLVTIQVKSAGNTDYGILALDETDFRVIDLTTNTVLAIDDVTVGPTEGSYVIDLTAAVVAGHTLSVEMYDTAANVNVALIGDNIMYKGISLPITVSA